MTGGPEPARTLGLRDATCVVVGAIVGVGIFLSPGRVARLTGSEELSLLAWGLGGVIALLGALTFAELGGLYPRSGGQYEVLRDAYGPAPAFMFVFCLLTAIQAGAIVVIGVICADNLWIAASGAVPSEAVRVVAVCALVVGLSAANVVGTRQGARIQNATVYAKIAALLAVTVLAAFAGGGARGGEPPPPELGPAAAVLATLNAVLFAFGGWQQATWVAGEVRRPERNVPAAIIGGVAIVACVYGLVNWAYFRLLGAGGVAATSSDVAARAVARAAPDVGGRAVAGAVAVSAFGVLNAQLLTGPRMAWAMARDGRFFRAFARLHPTRGTPARAIMLLAGASLALLLLAGRGGAERVMTGAVLVDWVFFALTGVALLVLRRKSPGARRPLSVPGYPFVPLLFVAGAGLAIAGSFVAADMRAPAVVASAWVAVAAIVYVLLFRRRR